MIKLILAFIAVLSLFLNSSAVMQSTPQQIDVQTYERLFHGLGTNKVLERLTNGGQILITKVWVGNKVKRPKLVAQYTDNMGREHAMDSLWLQPSLVYFMQGDQVLLKWHRDALFAFGLGETLLEKELE